MKKILPFILILFSILCLRAQVDVNPADSIPAIPTTTDTSTSCAVNTLQPYEFIRYDLDTLYWGHDSAKLVNFYAKLQQVLETKQGNIHILHIGASHVQGGTLSHRIRTHFLDEFGEAPASRGFIFPYSAASKCNNPYDYRVSKSKPFNLIRNVYKNYDFPLGGSGIAVWQADTFNSITVRLNAPKYDFATDTLILFAKVIGDVTPTIILDSTPHLPDLIDTVNDRYTFYFSQPIDTFRLELACDSTDTVIVSGFWLKNSRPGITYSSIGVNGAQASSYLRCKNFQRDIAFLQPDLVIFGIGVNDAYCTSLADFDSVAFQNNYLRLVETIRSANPECSFIFFSNNDTWKRGRKGRYTNIPTGKTVSNVMHRLADLTGGACWDQFAVMGGQRSMSLWQSKGLAQRDRVHFTAAGYNLIGDLFFDAFIRKIHQ